MIICARNGCEEQFARKTHNQKYCSDACCKIATNERVMIKYYERRDQRQGKTRFCRACGITRLSRYNDSQTCAPCRAKQQVDANNAVADMFSRASIAI